jgi:hypothetical protein
MEIARSCPYRLAFLNSSLIESGSELSTITGSALSPTQNETLNVSLIIPIQ